MNKKEFLIVFNDRQYTVKATEVTVGQNTISISDCGKLCAVVPITALVLETTNIQQPDKTDHSTL